MSENTNPQQVQTALAEKNQATGPRKKLNFDPATGQLIVKNPSDQQTRPNEVTVDQIYETGFFSVV